MHNNERALSIAPEVETAGSSSLYFSVPDSADYASLYYFVPPTSAGTGFSFPHDSSSSTSSSRSLLAAGGASTTRTTNTSKFILEKKSLATQLPLLDSMDYFWLTFSCFLALLANVSQSALLGKTSGLTTQVAAYGRTCAIVVGSWFLFGGASVAAGISREQVIEGVSTVAILSGVICYTWASNKENTRKKEQDKAEEKTEEEELRKRAEEEGSSCKAEDKTSRGRATSCRVVGARARTAAELLEQCKLEKQLTEKKAGHRTVRTLNCSYVWLLLWLLMTFMRLRVLTNSSAPGLRIKQEPIWDVSRGKTKTLWTLALEKLWGIF